MVSMLSDDTKDLRRTWGKSVSTAQLPLVLRYSCGFAMA